MNIIHIAPIDKRLPPISYGGTERVSWGLFKEQINLGMKAYIIGKINQYKISKKLHKYCINIDYHMIKRHSYYNYLLVVLQYIREYFPETDIIHNHVIQHNAWILNSIMYNKIPILNTLHYDPPFKKFLKALKSLKLFFSLRKLKKYANTISLYKFYSLKPYLGDILIGYVHNGIPVKEYFLSKEKDNFYLALGSVSYNKGTHIAIYIAKKLGLKLYIAGPIRDKSLETLLYSGENIKYLGEISEDRKKILLSRAKALLMPVIWDEPFGLVAIEALASGTPVVAFNRGALNEIIIDGVTGFLAEDISEYICKLGKIEEIDPLKLREYVLRRFDIKVIARAYQALYNKIMEKLI